MTAAEVTLKFPSVLVFQRGNFLHRTLTPLWIRGEGEISGQSKAGIIWRTFGPGHLQAAQKDLRGKARARNRIWLIAYGI